jgi:hypothetical protein
MRDALLLVSFVLISSVCGDLLVHVILAARLLVVQLVA